MTETFLNFPFFESLRTLQKRKRLTDPIGGSDSENLNAKDDKIGKQNDI